MKIKLFSVFTVSSMALLASGCSDAQNLPPAPKELVLPDIKEAPAPDPYLLQIGDTLDIKLRLNPELNESIIIPPDGKISTSMAKDIDAYNRTVPQVREALTEQYKKELSDPDIAVIMRSFAPNRIYVTGEVTSPGEFVTAGPSLTLLQAVSRAGGVKPSADVDNIVVLRHKNNAPAVAYKTDYEAARTGADPESDVRLAAYDVVFVPRTGIADIYRYYHEYVQQFLPPSFGMSYQLNPQSNVNR